MFFEIFVTTCKIVIDLAEKMELMLNLDTTQRLEMGRKGRERAIQNFDINIVINKYKEAIKSITNV